MYKDKTNRPTLVDLFAGAGGLSCGLQMAGFEPILANEHIPQYAETYKLNHPDTTVIVDDIREVSNQTFLETSGLRPGELDLLAGGPPCQGFSINAPIRSLDDDRNHLFKEFIRAAGVFRPKSILIENVTGIVSMGKGTVVEQIYKELEALGYRVEHRILFAGHYGVPQMRFRTIFLATRDCGSIGFPRPEYDAEANTNFTGAKELCLVPMPLFDKPLKPANTVGLALAGLPSITPKESSGVFEYAESPKSDYEKYLRQRSNLITSHVCNRLAPINLERLKHIPQGGSWRDIPFELLPDGLKRARRSDHTKRYGRLHPDALCSTVLTKCDPHWGSFFHSTEDRVLSVREAARIQSFPDRHHFTGTTTQQYEQVGNAVPALLARAIGLSICNALHGEPAYA